MPRIFVGVAIGNVVVLLAAGLTGPLAPDSEPERHVALAVFSLLLSCLLQVGVLTYFSVAGKLIAQALHLAHLDMSVLADVRRLKRSTTHMLGLVLVCVVFVTATGAVAWRTEERSVLHAVAGGLLLALHFGVFYRQYNLVVEMASVLSRTLAAHAEFKAKQQADGENS